METMEQIKALLEDANQQLTHVTSLYSGFQKGIYQMKRDDALCLKRTVGKLQNLVLELTILESTGGLQMVPDYSFTLEEIGSTFGITRERVRQIENSAIKKLKHPKIGRVLKQYVND